MKNFLVLIMSLVCVSPLFAQDQDLLQYVNTLQGSHNTFEFSHGRTSPVVGLPQGMNFWSPEGYPYHKDTIYGFGSRGGFSFMPMAGTLNESKKYGQTYNPDKVIAKPHHYKVTFDNGITTEITSTERCGYFNVAYPRTQQAYLAINGNASEIDIDAEQRTITSDGEHYFVIQFDQPFVSSGKRENGVYVEFKKGVKVGLKVATSQISLEQAKTTFDREIKSHSFNEVKEEAGKVWNKLLNKIVVEGGTPEQKKTFYSCFYRANLRPSKEYEVDKEGKPHFYYDGKVYDSQYLSNPILWDAYRTLFPLRNIIETEGQEEYVQSLLKTKQLSGWWEWRPNGPIMIGNHAISVFADAWAKGIRTFDPDTILKNYYHEVTYAEPHENAYNIEHKRGYGRMDYADYFTMGYVPYPQNTKRVMESTSRTLEYTYDDFCAYQLAKMTGNTFYEDIFGSQMYNYKNVFDPEDHFMKGRDSKGNWQKDFNPYEWGGPFVEGNAWPWKWFAPHDAQGLIALIGGKDKFAAELDELFTVPSDSALNGGYGERIHEISESVAAGMGQYGGINEPGFHIIYLYDYVGQPWKTQKLIRTSVVKLFGSGPDGFMGDEDGGAVSSWYIFSSLGFYPVTPGVDQYAIGSPLFDKATIKLENGKEFIIEAENNSPENVYIQSATLNGKPYSHNWITHDDIMNGGVLHFTMSSQPNKQRGTGDEDKPYSVSEVK